jgi:phage baseplate assembly protein gpV
MDRRERIGDPEEMMRMAAEGSQSKLWTAMPGIVQSFDAAAMTCVVQPAISAVVRDETGQFGEVVLPLLLDCPVVFPGGGGCTLTFPIKQGDECLVVFASRCIDSWWQLGGIQGQAELRMHDLSDGFVLPGVRSQPRKFNVDTATAQLRSDDGAAYVSVNPSTHEIKAITSGNITATASGNANVTAAAINLTGPVTINGTLHVTGAVTADSTIAATGNITGAGKSLNSHTHSGVQPGSGTSGPPS